MFVYLQIETSVQIILIYVGNWHVSINLVDMSVIVYQDTNGMMSTGDVLVGALKNLICFGS